LIGIAIIFLVTFLNTKGVKEGKIIQTIFTLTKVFSFIGLILAGLFFFKPEVWNANWAVPFQLQKINPDGSFSEYLGWPALSGAVAAALVGTIISYDAWNNVTFVAGEIINPKKNIGLSLLLGTLLVTLLYVSINVMYTAVLPMNAIATAEKDRVGTVAAEQIFGSAGTYVIAIMIMISAFGCNNGMILSGARVYYSMAKDGLFFKPAAALNRYAVPEFALWIQAIMASILCLSGRYGDLLDMVSFVVVLFYILTIAGTYILRVKKPELERPYKTFGYPVLPGLYILMGLSFCLLLIIYKPQFTWPGLIIALLGVPLYYLGFVFEKKTEDI
jgi:APA family basic amino acid/polyamine antiporter